jgi:hypothetical protein
MATPSSSSDDAGLKAEIIAVTVIKKRFDPQTGEFVEYAREDVELKDDGTD